MSLDTSENPEYYYEYQPDFHVWSVHFENLPELSVERILKLFSKYGRVQNVSQTGSSQGYVFISYRNKEHAKSAVLQVYQDTKIKLRAFNPRIRNIKDKQLNLSGSVSSNKRKTSKKENNPNLPITEKDYKKYYQAKSVFFANAKKLTRKQIKRFFSQFGEVDTVQQTGPSTGWCFVRFMSEASAKKSAKALMNHEFISLEEFESASALRSKKKQKEDKRSSDDSIVASLDVDTSSTRSRSRELYLGLNSLRRNESIELLRKFAVEYAGCCLQKVTVMRNNERTNKFFYLPMNSRVSWKQLRSVSVDYVKVEGIVVGNIDESCGTEVLKNLFGKCQPIFITYIQIIPDNSMRYCYVYFENDLYARAAERVYNDLEVCGRKLIVLRQEYSGK